MVDVVFVYLTITIIFSILLIAMGLMGGLGGVFDIHLDLGGGGIDAGGVDVGGIGQVMVITDAAGRTLITAVSKESLGTGERVHITGVEGHSLVVEKV